jgi:hypothetical protein
VSWSVCLICGKREQGSVRLAGFYRRSGFMFPRSAFSVPNLRFSDDPRGGRSARSLHKHFADSEDLCRIAGPRNEGRGLQIPSGSMFDRPIVLCFQSLSSGFSVTSRLAGQLSHTHEMRRYH